MSEDSAKETEAGVKRRVQRVLRRDEPGARVVRIYLMNEDVIEALYTVPSDSDSTRKDARTAWLCRSGSVETWDGWGLT